MLRPARSLLALIAFLAAALTPGAAVFVEEAHACSLIGPQSPAQFALDAEVIFIGTVESADAERGLKVRPEAFLKGPVSADVVEFPGGPEDLCGRANLKSGERALIFVHAGEPVWPYPNAVWRLRDGNAELVLGDRPPVSEAQAIEDIRAVTGQYAVPASSDDEGAGIDWFKTVIPVTVALLVVFGIGLVLMRTWHRIDPS